MCSMIIKEARLETVAVKPSQYPEADLPEIAFAGRSNVGKSSLLNLLAGRKSLARVSGSPGKTRTINFYHVKARLSGGEDCEFRIVDLPGYGYAKVSKSTSSEWGPMMEEFFRRRDNLLKVVQLVDIRHAPSAQDCQMYDYLRHYGLDGLAVATKADKVSGNERAKCLRTIRQTLNLSAEDALLPLSALKRQGCENLLAEIEKILEDRCSS